MNKFWTSNDLKTVVPPSILFKIFIIRKMNMSIFTVSLLRLTRFTPQSATWTPFRTPILTIVRFFLFHFNPEKFGKLFNSFINSITNFLFLRKKLVSLHKRYIKILYLKIFKLLTLRLFLTNIKITCKSSIKK